MRSPAVLVISPPSTRYAALHELELSRCGASRLSGRVWKATSAAEDELLQAASCQELAVPLLRAPTYQELLQKLCANGLDTSCSRPWRLRYENHATSQHGHMLQDTRRVRESEMLCAISRFLPGDPALLLSSPAAALPPRELCLLRCRRMWYLAECRGKRDTTANDALWSSRPYSFSASTDPTLARLAISIALQAHVRRSASSTAPSDGLVLDPCCGSGTLLFAAAERGVRSIGIDLNPIAVQGARQNLAVEAAASALACKDDTWPSPKVFEGDCTEVIKDALSDEPQATASVIVVASLPWGRQQRLEHAFHIRDMLAGLADALPAGTVFCCLSAAPMQDTLRESGLKLEAQAEVAGGPHGTPRCVLSVSRVASGKRSHAEETEPSAKRPLEANLEIQSLLTGGGLRTTTVDARGRSGNGQSPEPQLASGRRIALQCRLAAGGRAWIPARIKTAVLETQADAGREGWRCELAWEHDETSDSSGIASQRLDAATRLPQSVLLQHYQGPNWRFAEDEHSR